MSKVRVLVPRAAGTNCDAETQFAWEQAGAEAVREPLAAVLAGRVRLADFDILTLAGGFSYGDDISAGRVFARQIERRLADELRAFVDRGRLVLGVCNGFQVLVKAGLLPGGEFKRKVSITYNDPPGFQDRWICLEAGGRACAFLTPGARYEMPIAHGEGRIAFADAQSQKLVLDAGMGVLRYVAPADAGDNEEPVNPNGSAADLAGLSDATGRVLGLMPHPERFIRGTQHPAWTSRPARDEGDGLQIFRRAVETLR